MFFWITVAALSFLACASRRRAATLRLRPCAGTRTGSALPPGWLRGSSCGRSFPPWSSRGPSARGRCSGSSAPGGASRLPPASHCVAFSLPSVLGARGMRAAWSSRPWYTHCGASPPPSGPGAHACSLRGRRGLGILIVALRPLLPAQVPTHVRLHPHSVEMEAVDLLPDQDAPRPPLEDEDTLAPSQLAPH